MLTALEAFASHEGHQEAPSRSSARLQEQAASCLAAAASHRAVLALQAADEACRECHSTAGTSDLSSATDGTIDNSSSSSRWQEIQRLTVEAVEHMVSALGAEGLPSGVQASCTAALAPTAAELSFLAALQGQQEAQARLDRLFAESWRLQPPPAGLYSACRGCQLLQMLSPEAACSSGEGLGSVLVSGQCGQQLAQLAADSAQQPLQEPWRSACRGRAHLLAAAKLQREGACSICLRYFNSTVD